MHRTPVHNSWTMIIYYSWKGSRAEDHASEKEETLIVFKGGSTVFEVTLKKTRSCLGWGFGRNPRSHPTKVESIPAREIGNQTCSHEAFNLQSRFKIWKINDLRIINNVHRNVLYNTVWTVRPVSLRYFIIYLDTGISYENSKALIQKLGGAEAHEVFHME